MELNADRCSISTSTSFSGKDFCDNYVRILDPPSGLDKGGGGVPKCEISHVLDKVNEECVTFNDPNDVKPPELDDSAYWWSLHLMISPAYLVCSACFGALIYCKIYGKKKETTATQVEVQSVGNKVESSSEKTPDNMVEQNKVAKMVEQNKVGQPD